MLFYRFKIIKKTCGWEDDIINFTDVIKKRRSIRKYKDTDIPDESRRKLYRAAQLAPSGNNKQTSRFIFVDDEETRKEIVEKACHQDFLLQAPILMVACCEQDRSFNTAIAVDHLILAATNEGLGTCWVGWFDEQVIKDILGIPASLEVPIIVPIGYPAEDPEPRPRKELSDLIMNNKYE